MILQSGGGQFAARGFGDPLYLDIESISQPTISLFASRVPRFRSGCTFVRIEKKSKVRTRALQIGTSKGRQQQVGRWDEGFCSQNWLCLGRWPTSRRNAVSAEMASRGSQGGIKQIRELDQAERMEDSNVFEAEQDEQKKPAGGQVCGSRWWWWWLAVGGSAAGYVRVRSFSLLSPLRAALAWWSLGPIARTKTGYAG